MLAMFEFQRLNRESRLDHAAAVNVQAAVMTDVRPAPAQAAAIAIREILDEGPADADALARVLQAIFNAHQASLADQAMEAVR